MAGAPALRPMILFVHGTEDGPMPSLEWMQRRAGFVPDCDMGFDPKSPNRKKWLHSEGPLGRYLARLKRRAQMRTRLEPRDRAHWKGEKWWQLDGYALRSISAALAPSDGGDLTYAAFTWSGANSEIERTNAAKDLLSVIRHHCSRGFAPHIIAHSHGGNVVRLAAYRNPRTFRHVRSVTTVGAPYLRYSALRVVLNSVVFVIAALAVWGLLPLFYQGDAPLLAVSASTLPGEFATAMLRLLPLGALGGLSVYLLFRAFASLLVLWTHRRAYISASVRTPWRALFSDLDEAIVGLATLNRPVHIFSARFAPPHTGALGLMSLLLAQLFFASALVAFAPDVSSYLAHQSQLDGSRLGFWAPPAGEPPAPPPLSWGPLIAVAGLPLAFIVTLLLSTTLFGLASANALAMNQITLTQLRAKAFGDGGYGIAGVRRYPWRGGEHLATPLPKHVADEIEDAVRIGAFDFYGRFRDAMKPGATEYERDIIALITASLTWNELAHTTYLRSPAFLEYLARDILAATGDFRFTPLSDVPEVSA